MKKSLAVLAVSAGAVAMLASGCRAMMPSTPVKTQSLYSTDAVGYAVKPANANFGDRSVPVYNIGKVKKTATGNRRNGLRSREERDYRILHRKQMRLYRSRKE